MGGVPRQPVRHLDAEEASGGPPPRHHRQDPAGDHARPYHRQFFLIKKKRMYLY